jgi:hypothetical protein
MEVKGASPTTCRYMDATDDDAVVLGGGDAPAKGTSSQAKHSHPPAQPQ